MYRRLKQFEKKYQIVTSYRSNDDSPIRRAATNKNRTLTDEDIFQRNSLVSGSVLRRRVLRDNLIPYICNNCENTGEWKGSKLTLQLEHKDGDHINNELTNLCFLCPNCHSQTATYCGRNKDRNPPKQSFVEYKKNVLEASNIRNQPMIDMVLNSDIDFSKRGWSKQVAILLNKQPQKVKSWMSRYMPEFYNKVNGNKK